MRDVAIIGVGINKWGELWDMSLRDLFVDAALKALDDTKVDKIDSLYIGCMSGGLFVGQEHLTSILSEYLATGPIPACRVESACASGGLALRQAYIEVASGMSDVVMASGVEKMNDLGGDEVTAALATAADQEYEVFNGVTFPGLYAMMARAYMRKYGATREHLASVAVKNHDNGSLNKNAQFPMKITLDTVLNSVMVADPLTIFDCSPVTDGAASVILCPLDMAKQFTDKAPVKILASSMATNSIALHSRKDLTTIQAATDAAQKAYKMADLGPKDIDLCEVHDCFTIAEIMAIESLGFFEKGTGAQASFDGRTALKGEMPINTSGGLKSKGHPVGATGIAQAIEVVSQLRGECGERQVENAKIGMTQNMGGSGGSSVVHIYGL